METVYYGFFSMEASILYGHFSAKDIKGDTYLVTCFTSSIQEGFKDYQWPDKMYVGIFPEDYMDTMIEFKGIIPDLDEEMDHDTDRDYEDEFMEY